MGLILAVGISRFWIAAPVLALLWVLILARRKQLPPVKFPGVLFVLLGLIAVTSLWSNNTLYGLVYCLNILSVWLLLSQSKGILNWQVSAIFILFSFIGVAELVTGVTRIHVLSHDASVLGLAGLSFFPNIFAAIFTGLTISRTALAGSFIFTVLYPTRKTALAFALVAVVFLITTLSVSPDRITGNGIVRDNKLRENLIYGVSANPTLDIEPSRDWRWYGYGFAGYQFHTGLIHPHNIYILSWYELGAFSTVFWPLVLWLWWKYSRSWQLLAVVAFCGLLTVEMYMYGEGVYMLAALHYGTRNLPSPLRAWQNFAKMNVPHFSGLSIANRKD